MNEGKVCIVFLFFNKYVEKDWWLRTQSATTRNKYKKWERKVFLHPYAKNLSWAFEDGPYRAEVRIDD